MNLKAFFVAALQSALDLGIGTPDDVLRHVTPDVLSNHLPRPLWARLLTACLGAPKVDAQIVVETIGVPNLCEHIPATIIWGCIAELGARTIGGGIVATPIVQKPISQPMAASISQPIPIAAPPPEVAAPSRPTPPTIIGPTIPSLDADEPENQPTVTASRTRTPVPNRFRQASTGIGRLATPSPVVPSSTASQARRPMAQAAAPTPPAPTFSNTGIPSVVRPMRGQTDADFEVETDISKDDWKNAIAVDDEQLVDWANNDETVTSAEELTSRKR